MTKDKKASNTSTKVAGAILQKDIEVPLNGRTYKVPPPSIGTLILVSKKISQMPDLKLENDNKFVSVLRGAKDAGIVADIYATLILGAKHIDDRAHWWSRRTKGEALAKEILLNTSPKELYSGMTDLMLSLEVGDFFAITTFLQGINLTKPTKVETPTGATASGR